MIKTLLIIIGLVILIQTNSNVASITDNMNAVITISSNINLPNEHSRTYAPIISLAQNTKPTVNAPSGGASIISANPINNPNTNYYTPIVTISNKVPPQPQP
jgi:hypothetical protein